MEEVTTYVGMDAHKEEIVIAMLLPEDQDFVEWKSKTDSRSVRRLSRRLKRDSEGRLSCVYEAGPSGYSLQRELSSQGVDVNVVAPSLVPVKPGERIKTDRRDARKLAMSARAKTLTVVRPPSEEEESVRDLCRCRLDAKEDLHRSRQRLSKLLLRRGLVYRVGSNWTQQHRRWLRGLKFTDLASTIVFGDYLSAVEVLEERVDRLEDRIREVSEQDPYREPVGWLRCFRGIDTTTAMIIVSELHDFRRFEDPRKLMSYLGLVPSESSSGERRSRGSITKTGNGYVRRVLVESSWHYRHRPAVSRTLRKRREGQPQQMCDLADRAQHRLNRRYQRLVLGRGKPTPKAVVAMARELTGFIWAALYAYPILKEADLSS